MDLRKYVLTKKMHLRPTTYLNPSTDSEFTAEAFPHQNSSVWPINARSSSYAPPKTSPPTEDTTPAPQPFIALPDFFTNVPRSRSLTEHQHWFLTHVRSCKNHVSDRNDYEGMYMWGWVVTLELAFHQAEQADELSDFLFDVNPKLAHYSEKSLFVPPIPVGKTWIDVLTAGAVQHELGKGKGRAQDQLSSLEDCIFRRVHQLKLRWLNPDWTLGRKPAFTARPPVSARLGTTAVDTNLPRYNPAAPAPSYSIPKRAAEVSEHPPQTAPTADQIPSSTEDTMSDGWTCPPFFQREPGAAQVPLHSTHLVSQLTSDSPPRTSPPLALDATSKVGWTQVERGEEEDYEDVGEDEDDEQVYEDEGDDEEDGDDEGDEDGQDEEDGDDERDEDGEDEDGEDDEDDEYEDDDEEEESGEEADNPFEADVKAPDLPPVPQYASDLQSQKRSSRNDTAPIPYAEGGSMKTDLLDASMSVFDEILPHPVHDYSQQLQPDRASHTFFSEPPPYAAPEEVYVAPQPTEAFPSVFFQEPPVFNTAPPPYYIPPIFDVPPPYIGQTAPPEFYSPPQWANFKVVVQTEPIQPPRPPPTCYFPTPETFEEFYEYLRTSQEPKHFPPFPSQFLLDGGTPKWILDLCEQFDAFENNLQVVWKFVCWCTKGTRVLSSKRELEGVVLEGFMARAKKWEKFMWARKHTPEMCGGGCKRT